jgi:hypothetical protein
VQQPCPGSIQQESAGVVCRRFWVPGVSGLLGCCRAVGTAVRRSSWLSVADTQFAIDAGSVDLLSCPSAKGM